MFYDEAARIYLNIIETWSISEVLVFFYNNQKTIISESQESDLTSLVYSVAQSDCPLLKKLIFLLAVDYNANQEDIKKYVVHSKEPLNTKFRDKLEIYYTYKSIERDRKNASDISILFNNLLFFKKDFLVGKHIILKNFYKHEKLDSLSIGFVPYPFIQIKSIIQVDSRNNLSFPEKDKFTTEDKIFLKKCAEFTKNNKIDILFGPEIHGSKALDSMLKKLAFENHILLVVSPSYHQNKLNKSESFIEEDNHIKKFTICKMYPAQFSNGQQEDISFPNPFVFNIIHINGIGKIAFFICRDFVTDLNGLIEHLDLDIVIVQCFAKITSPFLPYLKNHASKKRIIILGNSCSAFSESSEKVIIQYGQHIERTSHSPNSENNKFVDIKCQGGEQCQKENCFKLLKVYIQDNEIVIEEKE